MAAARKPAKKPANAKKRAHKPGNKGRQGGAQPGAGRKPWKPSDEQRRQVKAMTGYGGNQEEIARHLGIAPNTLMKHCRDELDLGAFAANMRVAESLFQKAVGEPKLVEIMVDATGREVSRRVVKDAVPADTGAAIWWTKTRMGWKETTKHEHGGHDGGPIEFNDKPLDRLVSRIAGIAERLAEKESASGA